MAFCVKRSRVMAEVVNNQANVVRDYNGGRFLGSGFPIRASSQRRDTVLSLSTLVVTLGQGRK